MTRVLLSVLLAVGASTGLAACGSSAATEATAAEPTPEELDAIDAAAERAAEQITPESANAEFERLKAEIGHK